MLSPRGDSVGRVASGADEVQRHAEEKWLAHPNLAKMWFHRNTSVVGRMAFNSEDSKGAELKGAFFEFHEAEQSTKHVLYQLFAKDVNACTRVETLFREESLGMLVLQAYNKQNSELRRFLKKSLKRCVGKAGRWKRRENLKPEPTMIHELCMMVMEDVTKYASLLPDELCYVLKRLDIRIMEKFGRSVCGGFLFLRILLPALTLPHLYGVSKNVSPDARSVLVACCRVLQTAANCVGGRDLDYLATQDAIGVDQARTLTDAMDGLMEAVLEDGIYDRDEGDVQRTSSGTKAATAIARSLAVWGSYLSGFTDFQRDMKRVGFGLQLPPVLWDSEMLAEWFRSLDLWVYADKVLQRRTEGADLLNGSADEDPWSFIPKLGHRKKLPKELKNAQSDFFLEKRKRCPNMDHWRPVMTASWVAHIGMPQYARQFSEHSVMGSELKLMKPQELRLIGVKALAHRKFICKEAGLASLLDGLEQELSTWAVTRTSSADNVRDSLLASRHRATRSSQRAATMASSESILDSRTWRKNPRSDCVVDSRGLLGREHSGDSDIFSSIVSDCRKPVFVSESLSSLDSDL